MHEFGVGQHAEYLGDAAAGLAHDAARIAGGVVDEATAPFHALLVDAGADVAALEVALDGNDTYGQQAFMPLYEGAHGAGVQRDAAAQAQLIDQPALARRVHGQGGPQLGAYALALREPQQDVGLAA